MENKRQKMAEAKLGGCQPSVLRLFAPKINFLRSCLGRRLFPGLAVAGPLTGNPSHGRSFGINTLAGPRREFGPRDGRFCLLARLDPHFVPIKKSSLTREVSREGVFLGSPGATSSVMLPMAPRLTRKTGNVPSCPRLFQRRGSWLTTAAGCCNLGNLVLLGEGN